MRHNWRQWLLTADWWYSTEGVNLWSLEQGRPWHWGRERRVSAERKIFQPLQALNIQACFGLTFTKIFIQITFVKNIHYYSVSESATERHKTQQIILQIAQTIRSLSLSKWWWNQPRDARRLNLLFSEFARAECLEYNLLFPIWKWKDPLRNLIVEWAEPEWT